MTVRDRVREKIADLSWKHWENFSYPRNFQQYALADDILSIPELAVLADDQRLPDRREPPKFLSKRTKVECFDLGQLAYSQDMLSQGWRKMEVEE